ncbi:DUF45 domain-containing protein [Treponema bryantii]|uniref:DUF45 domain-containing protein n=1 Tax=Treponema bryantii TaxID=163 RepID=UPI0012DC5429|nr:DUF45 domain-containing protein [Treponema bryantii]
MEITFVIQKSRRRSMSIQVADDRKIIVKVPLGTPTFIAENFIREKKEWITNVATSGSSRTVEHILSRHSS